MRPENDARAVRPRSHWLILFAAALAASTAFATWWTTTLTGLPDVGDPFDLATIDGPAVPDRENSFVLYAEAVDRVGPEPQGVIDDWATAGPVDRAWLEANREALELWRAGTDRPGSRYIAPSRMQLDTDLPVVNDIRMLGRLAMLEAGRLEASGDLEGAWRWHRAVFRSSRHVARKGIMIERLVGIAMHRQACRSLEAWANDPRVDAGMLRKALDAARADDAMTGPTSDTLQVEYLMTLKAFDDPDLVRKFLVEDPWSSGVQPSWYARESHVFRLSKSLLKEPERSRRVLRLVFANLLAGCDFPPGRRPPSAGSLPRTASAPLVRLHALDESAPVAARALPPEKVLGWLRTTLYARPLLPDVSGLAAAVDAERATQANLLIALASRLDERQRGRPTESPEALVGPYLKALPEDLPPSAPIP